MFQRTITNLDHEVSETNQLLELMKIAMEDLEPGRYQQVRNGFITAIYISQDKLKHAANEIGRLPSRIAKQNSKNHEK